MPNRFPSISDSVTMSLNEGKPESEMLQLRLRTMVAIVILKKMEMKQQIKDG